MSLRLDWATFEAAKFAVIYWHYSKTMPVGKLVKIGVWEQGKFIGVVIFSHGVCPQIGHSFKLNQFEICELTRVALSKHQAPVSKIVSIAFRFLKIKCPKIKLVVSFADPEQNHFGTIYQAGNWIYTGVSLGGHRMLIGGKWVHDKTVKNGRPGIFTEMRRKGYPVKSVTKFRYLMPLSKKIRDEIKRLEQPYPKRPNLGDGCDQHHSGGATPTRTLQDGNV